MTEINGVIVREEFISSVILSMQVRNDLISEFKEEMMDHYSNEIEKVNAIETKWWNVSLRSLIWDYNVIINYNIHELQRFGDFKDEIDGLQHILNNVNVEKLVIPLEDLNRYQRIVDASKNDHMDLRKAMDKFPRLTFEEFKK